MSFTTISEFKKKRAYRRLGLARSNPFRKSAANAWRMRDVPLREMGHLARCCLASATMSVLRSRDSSDSFAYSRPTIESQGDTDELAALGKSTRLIQITRAATSGSMIWLRLRVGKRVISNSALRTPVPHLREALSARHPKGRPDGIRLAIWTLVNDWAHSFSHSGNCHYQRSGDNDPSRDRSDAARADYRYRKPSRHFPCHRQVPNLTLSRG